ncbi:septal ring lytic transglycosylase RlpA family protein [Hymenobacter busanensis]|uniref:Probable endolytic peptidoglycan transglycosylase RlpA n=1 Tax=Hymenobacter busanensis TaxID=2607656 RepID=A0A7L4ZYJ1_9BACT|nr:septal ring lytic transglycosylase RlpA family protein [Hymenobacter busanensis]KAA9331405.1 septal ring lytic transglycosylase RlpA family protein [Hymenobacter busanensis]QHJ08559.1 septal ring lytic transglycosylase RlpA family protein [Hymenobacter busanensis]
MQFKQRLNLSGFLMMWLLATVFAATPLRTLADDTPAATTSKSSALRGRASWYGREHQGHRTSNGERFDRNKYTCAHKTLPFGTKLRVTNARTGKAVVVRVSDRGPFRHQRILDLAEVAARPLDIVRLGAVDVVAEVVPNDTPLGPVAGTVAVADVPADSPEVPAAVLEATADLNATPDPAPTFVVQAGTFATTANAEALRQRIAQLDNALPIAVQPTTTPEGRSVSRVVVGQGLDRSAAEDLRKRLQQRGINGLVRQAENL